MPHDRRPWKEAERRFDLGIVASTTVEAMAKESGKVEMGAIRLYATCVRYQAIGGRCPLGFCGGEDACELAKMRWMQ